MTYEMLKQDNKEDIRYWLSAITET